MEATTVQWKMEANEQGCGERTSCWCIHPHPKAILLLTFKKRGTIKEALGRKVYLKKIYLH